jgi:hypothetical protein
MSDSIVKPLDPLPEIGKESPPAGESAVIDALRALHLQVHQKQPGPDRRGEHPKQHAGLWAQFEVRRDIPPELRVGLFATPGRYTALVRFSNGRSFDDTKPDVHGMAIKVLVPGNEGAPRQQDFLTADHPIFFARNVQHVFDFLKATATGTPAAQLATTTHPKLIGYTSVAKSSPLNLSYWSQTPYKLGDGAVKYFVRPSGGEGSSAVPLNPTPDGLREALAEQLTFRKLDARFDLCVNPQTDAVAMPIEDATIEWTSPAVRVAEISLYPQKFDSPEQMAFFENLSWSPWNALPEHAPLGGINRARRPIYAESSALRHTSTGIATVVPTGRESF